MQLVKTVAIDDVSPDDIGGTTLTTMLRHSMFWTPEREAPSTWSEHVPFAFWLVDVLRPRRIVELGTYHGVSYSAICQTVKTLCLPTACFAIDTWTGDEHSGPYGEDVYRDFKAFHDERYGGFSQLVRTRFDDALERFAPRSIDLLHIDGLHTYEAVRHDYESWLPKLSANGIILLPGIGVPDSGAAQLWSELTANKPHFELTHGRGLGVLGCGYHYPTTLTLLFHATMDQRRLSDIRQTFMTLGRASRALPEQARLEVVLSEHTTKIAELQEALSKRDGDIAMLNDALSKSTATISRLGDAQAKVHRLNRIVSEMKASWSWRMTLPLRRAASSFRALIRGEQPDPGTAAPDYETWILKNDRISDDDRNAIRTHIASFANRPKFSILMPVHTAPQHLQEAIDSVVAQLYQDWELCIAADASTSPQLRDFFRSYESRERRIKLRLRDADDGIAACTNAALDMASGDWIVLMNPDDVLSEHALYMIADAVNQKPGAAIVYSDEDKINATGRRSDPYFKPDWDYDLFLGFNLINHLGAYRGDLARSIGGFRGNDLEGSQYWDFALRVVEAGADPIVHHVPFILYHSRQASQPPANAAPVEADDRWRLVVAEHMERTGQAADVTASIRTGFLTIRRRVPIVPPLVSIVIPTKDRCGLLKTCTDGLLHRTSYSPIEIVIVDNGSTEPDACDLLAELGSRPGVVIVRDDGPFNFSTLVNRGVAASSGDVCLLLNNDIDVINHDWLDELVAHASRPDVGAVGAKLYYPDDTLQHGGVILGIGGVAAHVHKTAPRSASGYRGRLTLIHALSCVTAACLAVRRAVYDEVGGFDEHNLAVAFNDVDFCIRLRQAGYRIIWTPNAELYHHESVSRGHDLAPEKAARFAAEVQCMRSRWSSVLDADPHYNPNLCLGSEFFEIADRSRAQKPWRTQAVSARETFSASRMQLSVSPSRQPR